MKILGIIDYIYGLLIDGNLALIVGHVLYKFEPIWSKITP
jgi:hypothetical protein